MSFAIYNKKSKGKKTKLPSFSRCSWSCVWGRWARCRCRSHTPGKERPPCSARTAGGWREPGSPQPGSPAAWPPSSSSPPLPPTGLKVMMDDGKGLGKAAPLKWMELQRNSFISLSHTLLPLFKSHLFLSYHVFRTCSHTAEPREGPSTIFPRFCLPFKISVARISKQGKLRIVRTSPPIQTPKILCISRIRQHRRRFQKPNIVTI